MSLQRSSLIGYWAIAITLSIVIRFAAVLLLLASTNNWFGEMREKIQEKISSVSGRRRSSEYTRESMLSDAVDEYEMSEDLR